MPMSLIKGASCASFVLFALFQFQNTADAEALTFEQCGEASWYSLGGTTASGEPADKNGLTAAHRTLPFGTMVEVTNLKNNKTVTVRINDRGPYAKKRIIDLTLGAAKEIDFVNDGVAQVKVTSSDENLQQKIKNGC